MPDVALVTGANRGIGLEVCRQLADRGFAVILGARDAAKGERASEGLRGEGLEVLPRQLDVSDDESVRRLAARVEEFGRLDVLVNNAGILYDTWQRVLGADLDVVREALETNTFGPWRMCRAFAPLLRRSERGRIVNVTSGAGSLAGMTGAGTPAYNVSKVSLNALTRMVAADLRGSGVLVNAVDPGWTATDMGGHGGRSVGDGASGIVWAATLPDGGPTGGLFYDGEPEDW